MIPDQVLDLAVGRGLIAPGQAQALRSLAREVAPPPLPAEPVDEERLRFVTGFADIFVTIGLALFLGAATYLIGRSFGVQDRLGGAATSASLAAMAWLLAEFFTRLRRMALPSIVLLVVFASASFLALTLLLAIGEGPRPWWWISGAFGPGQDPQAVALAAVGTAALAALHYWRFQVPITVAAGVAALSLTALALLYGAAPETTVALLNPLLLCVGLAVFALAMRFDLADPARLTRRTDIAFWLHILASPLIVHSVFQMIGAGRGVVSSAAAIGIIGIFLGLAVVAVLVDRRAMLVSGLIYAGIAFGSLIRTAGVTANLGVPVTLLVLGAFVLTLSAGWHPLRRLLLGLLPEAWATRLPERSA